ncbi:MAG TPA: polyprenyl synthetase family protein [Bacteroidales bacterium]|nr:polyprenyl synthetase family protein [Bacteroidales bacterium]
MLSLDECSEIINRQLQDISLPGEPSNLYEPIRYMLELGGKRIRPALVLMGCNVFSDNTTTAYYPALAIEVFHNFTLMHDDIMDKSDVRRNHPSVHRKWNPNVAILSGDAMLIKAYELLCRGPAAHIPELLSVFNQTALEVCEGQQYDLDYEHNTGVSLADYLRMVELKTAVLLAASLKIGAITGDAGMEEAGLLYGFGRNIGIAFQLQDDLLDVFADAAFFGKETGNDIVSNKKTVLLVQALEISSGATRKELMRWLKRRRFNRNDKIDAVRNIFSELNLEELTRARIGSFHDQAVKMLDSLPVAKSRKTVLLDFSEMLMNRKK